MASVLAPIGPLTDLDRSLTRQIPWLRVFVEGVVIVGKLEN